MAVESFCRLCARKSENYVKIYEEEGKKLNLATKIIRCLQIWLKPDDILPKTVCVQCCTKLDQYFNFYESCTQSQKSLMAIFNETKEMVVSNLENGLENSDDYFMKSISDVISNNSTGQITNEPEIANDINDRNDNNYHDSGGDYSIDHGEFEFKVNDSDSCNGSEDDCEKEWDNCEENSEPNLHNDPSEKRRTSKRKLSMPMKRKSKNDIQSNKNKMNRSNVIKNRSNRLNATKNAIKKGKSISNKKLSHTNEVSVKVKDKVKNGNLLFSSDKNENRNEKHVEQEEEEVANVEKSYYISSSRRVMEGHSWKCTNCTEELKTLTALKDHHRVVHKQLPNFMCSFCTKVYTRYRSFARHVKLHGNPKKFSCEVCGKGFSQKTVLQSHRTVHSEERPHVCQQCGKAFKQFSSLYLHSKCHLPEEIKPKFSCNVCPKEFSTKHTLETHMKIHTGERNYICDICGKSFIAKGSLDYHILAHSDSKPYNCSVCNKGFKTVRLLTKHSTLHTGIKPHQCDVCGKQFRERSALKEHNRIHTGAMPYSCEFCGKLFRFKGILTVHRRQHTGERPYSCQDCRRQFTNWANYNKHMKRRHHNGETIQNNRTASVGTSSDDLGVPQDLHAQEPGSQQSPQSTLHQLSSAQQCSSHVINIMPQEERGENVHIPPPISVQQLPPIPSIQLHMQQPVIYNDNTSGTSNSDSSSYKLLPDDQANNVSGDIYRVSHYLPAHTLSGMSYYIPPIHQPILPTRNQ